MSSAGTLVQSVPLGHFGECPIFDGRNIWVTSQESVVTVVAAADGVVVATLSGNGLNGSFSAAFDGERVLVTSEGMGMGGAVSLWRAADLEPLGFFPIADPNTPPFGACSDGDHFWIGLYSSPGEVVRFLNRAMKRLAVFLLIIAAVLAGGAVQIVQDQCGPFTDVTPGFCPYVLELYYLGVTVGTSATTFSPDQPLTRGQAAVFVSKGLNQSLARSSRRAALGQWWTPSIGSQSGLGFTTVGSGPIGVDCDGADIWVSNRGDSTVSRVRASDGKLLETWTGASEAWSVLVAMGKVFVSSAPDFDPIHGKLYMIDPTQPPGPVTTIVPDLGMSLDPRSLAFDGSRIWANSGFPGAAGVAIITPAATPPWPVTVVTGSAFGGFGIVYDGSNIWVTAGSGLLKLDSSGNILQTVPLAGGLGYPAFDGANIWVPLFNNSVAVIQASSGAVIATLTGNGFGFLAAAFDGQRILTTNTGDSVSLWNAADLTPIGVFQMPVISNPYGTCSDGINFWIALTGSKQLARF